jgi:hypothetical protein
MPDLGPPRADSPLPHERGELRVIPVIGDREQDVLTGDFLCIPKTGPSCGGGGVFVAVALSLVITIGQQVLETTTHFAWQTFVVLGLEIFEVVLLALAAVRAISASTS